MLSRSVVSDSFVTPWAVARQAPLSVGVLKARIRIGLLCPPPGDLPIPGIEPGFPALQEDSLLPELPGKPPKERNSCHIWGAINNSRAHSSCITGATRKVTMTMTIRNERQQIPKSQLNSYVPFQGRASSVNGEQGPRGRKDAWRGCGHRGGRCWPQAQNGIQRIPILHPVVI